MWRTIGYTLALSVQFLAKNARAEVSLSEGDVMLDRYWRRIFNAGNAELWVEGRELVPPMPVVIMSNHTSLADIPSMLGAYPRTLRMVTKEELTRLPIWGRALKASGFVPISRTDRTRAIAQLEVAKAQLQRGISVWISPEGTRSRSRKLMPFKKGGFHLAAGLGVPILPAFIEGTETLVPPDSFSVQQDGKITVRFGAPLPTAHIGTGAQTDAAAFAQLMAEVREAVLVLSRKPRAAIDSAA